MPIRRTALLVATLLLLCACSKPRLDTGEGLFNYYCAPCHQKQGTGKFLQGIPSVKFTRYNASEIAQVISGHQRPKDTRMPVFDELTPEQTIAIAAYVQHAIKKH
jgi:mono/diheme cytochrome c family protein